MSAKSRGNYPHRPNPKWCCVACVFNSDSCDVHDSECQNVARITEKMTPLVDFGRTEWPEYGPDGVATGWMLRAWFDPAGDFQQTGYADVLQRTRRMTDAELADCPERNSDGSVRNNDKCSI